MAQGNGRRLRITHHTGYRYSEAVDASFNEVRMTPLNGDGQTLLSHVLSVSPAASIQTYSDYWGAHVESFDVHASHRLLEISATSTVDTPPLPPYRPGTTWDEVRSAGVQDEFAELLTFTDYVDDLRAEPELVTLIEALSVADSPELAAGGCVAAVRARLTYTPGVTTVSTTASQAWQSGHGVCQDFTHTTLALLRSLGIPARYVSGYLHTEEDSLGLTVTGESHAWVEYWDGRWQAIDPTNDRAVGSAHVIVARGRDYADVPPLKGIYAGGRSEGLGVVVEITQI